MQPEGTRRAISRRLRFEVLRRDDYSCRYCGQRAPDVKLTIDHVIPATLGGSDEPSNLVTACKDCNAGKSSIAPDSPIVENVADDAVRWVRAMARAAELQATAAQLLEDYIARVNEAWTAWNYTHTPCDWIDGQAVRGAPQEREWERPTDWRDSVERFFSQRLESDVICRAIDTAMAARNVKHDDRWRYVCGICWRQLRERQDLARALINAEATA